MSVHHHHRQTDHGLVQPATPPLRINKNPAPPIRRGIITRKESDGMCAPSAPRRGRQDETWLDQPGLPLRKKIQGKRRASPDEGMTNPVAVPTRLRGQQDDNKAHLRGTLRHGNDVISENNKTSNNSRSTSPMSPNSEIKVAIVGRNKENARKKSPPPRNNDRSSAQQNQQRPTRRMSGRTRSDLKRQSSESSIIGDRGKLETRWNWTKLLVLNTLKPYVKDLCQGDDLLPDLVELDEYNDSDDDDEEEANNCAMNDVRDQMLDDGQLTEREIAAFFAGFTMFNAKLKSLKSQLESAKLINCGPSTSSSSIIAVETTTSKTPTTKAVGRRGASIKQLPTLHEKKTHSFRSMSIKKIQEHCSTNPEHKRLLQELEEAEKKQIKLERLIKQAGVRIAEDVSYQEAKENVSRAAARMQEIGSSEVTHLDKKKQAELREEYFKLEQDMEKFSTALMLTDEYIEEQEEKEQLWEQKNEGPNMEALRKLRRHMPVSVKSMSESQLCSQPTPNGKRLPREIAKKFKRTNVLQLLRTNPEDILRMHPSTLENMRVIGMTLTERRAMYAHLKDVGPRWKAMQADAMTGRKWAWYTTMQTNFKETLAQYEYHVEQYGPPGNHPYATRDSPNAGCPLMGKQCPLRADMQPCYDEDYGFTQEAVYEVTMVKKVDVNDAGAKAVSDAAALAKEKRVSERLTALKKHYKGVLQVSLASGSCEMMDEALERMESLQEKWIENGIIQKYKGIAEDSRRKETIRLYDALNDLRLHVLQFAERSGMQLTGKKDVNADKLDGRSALEISLCEEVCEYAVDFFRGIKQRMKELDVVDKRMKISIDQLRELLGELHERNMKTLKKLNVKRSPPSRKRRTREAMTKEMKEKHRPDGDETAARDKGVTNLSEVVHGNVAVAARGSGRGGGGRDELMSAIAARGRGGRGAGGTEDLMSAIAARGNGGGPGIPKSDGRNDLLAAIAARGRGSEPARSKGKVSPIRQSGRSPDPNTFSQSQNKSKSSGRSQGSTSSRTGNFLAEIKAMAAARDSSS